MSKNLIGVIRLDRLGDTVLTLPAVKVIRETYRDFLVVGIFSTYNSQLFIYNDKIIHPYFDIIEVIDINLNYYSNDVRSFFIKIYDNFYNFINVLKFVKLLNRKYNFDRIYVFSPNFVSYLLGSLINSKQRYTYFYKTKLVNYYLFKSKYKFFLDQFDKVYEEEYIYSNVRINHELVQNLLVLREDKDINLNLDLENITNEDLRNIRPFLCSPFLNMELFDILFFDKNLFFNNKDSIDFLRKLLNEIGIYIKNRNLRFAFITNREWNLDNVKILRASIPEVLYLVSNAKVVISFDGGFVHIASAFNVPIICLFSNRYFYFDSYRWAPLSDVSYVIKLDIFDENLNSWDFSNLDYFNVFYQIKYYLEKLI